jgi:hypothetical protein
MADDYDWLDLKDPRSITTETSTTPSPTATDINKVFDDIAAMFEVYPQPPEKPPKSKQHQGRGKTLHLNTQKTKSK